jgi:hypothetical protein
MSRKRHKSPTAPKRRRAFKAYTPFFPEEFSDGDLRISSAIAGTRCALSCAKVSNPRTPAAHLTLSNP